MGEGRHLSIKKGTSCGVEAEVHCFEVSILSGIPSIQDPDQLIYAIDWKTAEEISPFPEDRHVLMEMAERSSVSDVNELSALKYA